MLLVEMVINKLVSDDSEGNEEHHQQTVGWDRGIKGIASGGHLSGSEEHATLDLGVMSLSRGY